MKYRVLLAASFAIIYSVLPITAFAQPQPDPSGWTSGLDAVPLVDPNLAQHPDFKGPISNITNFFATMAAILAVAALIAGGIMYILSLGDESKASNAKKIILYAIIGLIIIGLSAMIVNVVIGLI